MVAVPPACGRPPAGPPHAAAPPRGTSPLRRATGDTLPVVLAYVPFGLTLGTTLATTPVPPLVGWASSPLLFGGAAQLVSVQLLGTGANAAVVVAAALMVNARLALYSATLAPHAAAWPARRRWAAAYLLADPVFALAAGRFGRPDHGGSARDRFAYYTTAGSIVWVAWLAITGLGALLAGVLPASLHLDLAAPLTFLLLLLPMMTTRAYRIAAAVAAVVAVAAAALPLGLGLLAGAAAGVTAGALWGARRG
jgi:predicted branched-subunit amino acid permease